jgi:non-ribosomal peptide synthetase component F
MFIALSRSACLVIVPDDVKRAPEHLAYVIDKHEVTVMQVTPALFKQFTNCFITNKVGPVLATTVYLCIFVVIDDFTYGGILNMLYMQFSMSASCAVHLAH